MKFNIVDTESIYRRLLAEPNDNARETIFRDELVEPFKGLAQTFGLPDGMTAFKQWNMSPDQFSDGNHPRMVSIVEALAQANAWQRAAASLDKGWAAFSAYAERIPHHEITFGLMVADMSSTPQAGGYSGFGAVPGWVMTVYGEPNADNLKKIEAATVHELHHNLWSSVVKYNFMTMTVGEYMIMEGLAESFAAELYGEDKIGPWVTGFDESRLDTTKAIFREGLKRSGFNVIRGYIFGGEIAEQMGFDKIDVPIYAGYALGYKVVQAYLKRTGKKVVEASFIPVDEIIAESRFFE
ncbi:MAG: DUF2268 domain-containing putative Zn-dependent protease [Anaerolineae bacterium]